MHQLTIEVVELDLRHSRRADFTKPLVQQKWLRVIDEGKADALVITPPCSTFSRAPWANDRGPFPLRSARCLRGFTWNSAARKRKAGLGNTLADFSFEAMKRQLKRKQTTAFMEQPEDLGATKRPRVPGHRPGSMWQFPQHLELMAMDGVKSVALAQIDFGAETPKPTRLLMRAEVDLHPEMYEGPRMFDETGFYVGPLPRKEGPQLIGRDDGGFKTAAAAQWPSALCAWVAEAIVCSFLKNRVSQRKGPQIEDESGCGAQSQAPGEEEVREPDPFLPLARGGIGPARGCEWKGGIVPFHDDGGCLMSPGRWDIPKRRYPDSNDWCEFRKRLRSCVVEEAGSETLLERECFAMARGEGGCRLVQSESLQVKLGEEIRRFCGGEENLLEIAEGQPFKLRAMRRVLEKAEDADCAFLEEAETGLPLGVKHALPRTPSAFERQVDWSLKDDPTEVCELAKANYPSARDHEDHLRSHLEAAVAEGLVRKMSMNEFEEEFGEDRAIAALAVLVEDKATGKQRVIHDGSHGVRVNHRIRCLDKLRMPCGREKRHLLSKFRAARDVVFSLIGDFGKAHRRFKYRKDEQGYLACKVREDEDVVYVNCVGTFGISSTPYWWGRISAALVRLVHYLVGPGVPLELLLYADDLESMGIGEEGRKGAVLSFIYMGAFGSPFKWGKQRGGMCTEWVGLTTNYGDYSFGLSERRAVWLIDWIGQICAEKKVDPRNFAAGLGRLGFAATALPWEKPFLGPLYVWAAAVREQRGKVLVPWAILIILDWVAERLRNGGRMEVVRLRKEPVGEQLLVYTDARASDHDACIGGFLALSEDLGECPWFSIEVDSKLAPWWKVKGGSPRRAIAALELLATLVAVKLWSGRAMGGLKLRMKAFTDNRGNSFAIAKGMSTKYPITVLIVLLMELSEELREKDLDMDLEWVRREENVIADDLSNGRCEAFKEENREVFAVKEGTWRVLSKLQKRSEELYEGLKSLKNQGKAGDERRQPVVGTESEEEGPH